MRDFFLRKVKNSSNQVFKNPNLELKKQVQDFKFESNQFESAVPGICSDKTKWKITERNKTEVRCEYGKNILYFPVKLVDDQHTIKATEQLGKLFNANEHFTPCFGPISKINKLEYEWTLDVVKMNHPNRDTTTKKTKVKKQTNQGGVYRYTLNWPIDIEDYESINLDCRLDSDDFEVSFNKEGDFVYEGYEDLRTYENKEISPAFLMKKLESLITRLPIIGHSRGKYYSRDLTFELGFNESKNPNDYDVFSISVDIFDTTARPKILEECNSDHLIQAIYKKMSPSLEALLTAKEETKILNTSSGMDGRGQW